MADVGILNLQIHHDSSQAEAGLQKLADALFRVKRAVNGGLKLSGVATQIRNIAKVVNENVNDTTISKLAEFGNALSRLKGLGNVSINIKSSNKIENTLESIEAGKRSIEQIGATGKTVIKELENDFGNFGNTMENITDTFVRYHDNVVATANNKPDFSAFDPSHLPLEALGMQLDKTSAEWKNYGAMVKDSFEEIKNAGKLDTVSSIKEVGNATTAIIPYQEEVGHTWERITAEMNEKSKGVSDAYKMACEQALEYNADLNRRIGAIYDKRFTTDITGNRAHAKALRGDWGEREQLEAISSEARSTGQSIEEVRAQIEKLMAPINKVRTEIKYLFDTLGNVPKNMNWSTGIDRMLNIGGKFKDAQESAQAFMTDAYHRYQELVALLEKPVNINWRDAIDQLNGVNNAAKSAEDSMSAFLQGMQGDTDAAQQIRELNPELAELSNTCSTAQEALEEVRRIEKETASSALSLKFSWAALRESIGGLKSGIKNLFPTLTSLLGRFKQIVKYRMLRAVLRYITEGFSEGVQNVYNYSKAIGSSFAPAMDEAATVIQQMKNSVGAAIAPLLQSLIPVLQTVVNWFITAVNYLNQFLALLRGQATWTRAVPATTTAFKNQEKAAKGAGAAIKDLLADWDELNIIQSNTSGTGTGLGDNTAEDYLKMFEEVGVFDSKIKDIVEYVKNNFNDLLNIAELIGGVILAWKISSALSGIIGTLAGLAGAVFTLGLVFEVSTEFTKQFLETGDAGWLVGDILGTLVGGLFTKTLLDAVLGTTAGTLGFGLTFIVSAAATIIANVEKTDIGALSRESLLADVTAALEGSVAGATLGYMIGGTLLSAVSGGVVGLLATFGVAIGVKANAQVSAEGITSENIFAKLIGIASLGLSGGFLGITMGGGAAGAAGMAMLFGGAPIATFGVALGINAINEVVDGRQITADVVKKNFLAGGLVGTGLAIVGGALVGTGTGLFLGAAAAALTIGALFGIEAIIAGKPTKVTWGDYKATKEEIETFVNTELFKDPPDVTISLIKATIEPLGDAKTQLETDAANAIGTVYALKVGTKTTVEELKTQIDTLVDSFNNASTQYQNTLEVALSLVPVKNGNGEDQSAEVLKNSSERWSALNTIMTDLGNNLADAYKVAYDARLEGNIDEAAEETIKKISEMMSRVATAISTGQSRANASQAIREQMANLSKETLGGILDEYEKQRDALMEELTNIRKESANGLLAQQYAFEELAAYALEDAGGDFENETYKYYMELARQAKADYELLMENLQKDVEAAADKLTDEDTVGALRKFLISSITNALNENDMEYALASAGYFDVEKISAFMAKTLSAAVTGGDITKAQEEIENMFDAFLMDLVGEENFSDYKKAIEDHVIGYGDLFSDTFLTNLKDTLGISGMGPEVNALWNEIVAGIFRREIVEDNITQAADEVTNIAEEATEGMAEAIESADVDTSGITEPLEEAVEAIEDFKEATASISAGGRDLVQIMLDKIASGNVDPRRPGLAVDSARWTSAVSNGYGSYADYMEVKDIIDQMIAEFQHMDATGTYDVNKLYAKYGQYGNFTSPDGSVSVDEKDVSDGVKEGTSEGFRSLLEAFNANTLWLQRIYNKDTTVKIFPSTAAGLWQRQNAVQYSNATGENP